MDSIKAEKLQAMRNYKKRQFLNNLILHSLIASMCTLFCSYFFWFPQYLCSSVKQLAFVSLPNFKSFFFNPKCLFLVGNAIIVYLVRESKLSGSSSSLDTEIYDEYVERSRSIREFSTQMEKNKEGKLEMNLTEERVKKIEEKCIVEKERKELVRDDDDGDEEYYSDDVDDDHDKKEEDKIDEEEEEEPGLPTEELNKRVEDFIARVNRQRWLEARLVDCGRG